MPIFAFDAPVAGACRPQTICCADRICFHEATTSLSFFNFDGCNFDSEFTEYPDGLSIQGVRFSISCHADFPTAVLVYTSGACSLSGKGASVLYAGGAEALHITLPAGTTAFGVDISAESLDPAETLRAEVNGEMFALPLPDTESKPVSCFFIGFLSAFPITQMSFFGGDSGPVLSGIHYGQAQSAFDALRNTLA